MLLRRATSDDILPISEMAHRIWRAHYPDIIGTEQVEYMLGLLYSPPALQQQMEDGQVFWLLEDGEKPLGYLAVSQKNEGRYFLHKFYLDNAQRGRGLGTTAFRLLLDQYPDVQELRLTVNRENIGSINFYFKVGFTIEQCVNIPIGEGFMMLDFQMLWRRSV